MSTVTLTKPRELTFTRLFDAPPELVFKLWTDPAHARNWWGPRDYPATHLQIDARPGGRWRNCLQSVETGRELWQGGVFREVLPPHRLVFTFAWDEEGERGIETLVTVTFAERAGKTLMTFHQAPFQSANERDGHHGGWMSTFDRLADYIAHEKERTMITTAETLPATREVTITRTFDAPRELVFKMWIDPKHLAQWWGPQGFTNPVCEVDVRPGGRIYIVMRGPKGTPYDADFPMSGTFREIVPNERLVFTSFAEDKNGNAQIDCLSTVTFEAQGAKTKLTVHARGIALVEIGKQMLAGMDQGWSQSIDRLEALVAAQ